MALTPLHQSSDDTNATGKIRSCSFLQAYCEDRRCWPIISLVLMPPICQNIAGTLFSYAAPGWLNIWSVSLLRYYKVDAATRSVDCLLWTVSSAEVTVVVVNLRKICALLMWLCLVEFMIRNSWTACFPGHLRKYTVGICRLYLVTIPFNLPLRENNWKQQVHINQDVL